MSDAELVIRKVTNDIWTFSKPFERFGYIPFGGRSTAIKLADGGVWILASTPLTNETKTTLEGLGKVKYIVAPDSVHNLYLSEYKKAYPDAHLIGVEEHLSKPNLNGLTFTGCYGRAGDDPSDTSKFGYTKNSEIQACYFSGFKNKDVAFLHTASKTLIEADLLFNLPAKEQYSKSKLRWFPFIDWMSPGTKTHQKMVASQNVDTEAMRRDAQTVASWDFERIIPCHGDVIETGGKKAWTDTYKEFIV